LTDEKLLHFSKMHEHSRLLLVYVLKYQTREKSFQIGYIWKRNEKNLFLIFSSKTPLALKALL